MRDDPVLTPLNFEGAATDEASRKLGTRAYFTRRFSVLGTLSAMFFGLLLGSFAASFLIDRLGVPFGEVQHWRIAGSVLGAGMMGLVLFLINRSLARRHAKNVAQAHRERAARREAEHARKMSEAKTSGAFERWES